MKKRSDNIALVRLGDVIQPLAGEHLRDIPLNHLVNQDVYLYTMFGKKSINVTP